MKKSIKQAAKPTDKSDHYFFWLAGLTLLWAVAGAAAAQMPDKANAAETQKDIAQLLSSMHGPNGAMAESGKGKSARVSLKDGCLRSLAAPANHFFPVSEIVAGNPTATAKNFIAEHGVAFGIKSKAVGFAPKSSKKRNSRSYERFRQTYSGIPVYGAEVIVQLNASGGVEYVASDIIRQTSAFDEGKVTVIPTILAEDAEFLAIELMAKKHKGLQLVSTDAQLLIYQPAVVGNSGSTRLVWQTVVVSVSVPTVNEFILIDAHTGEVALQYTQIMNARVRQVHDSANTAADPGTLRRSEGGPTTGIADVDDCYDFLSDIYDFYFDEHGRDSIDDAGMTLSATVRICPYYPDFCPYSNAFWNGSRMYFGEGFVVDDVTAHEMTHGVTQYESGLIYLNESGAINESFSDMWGEWIDLTNGAGNDASSVRWLMGEDIGAIRNMADPPAFGDPDRMGSPLWYTGSGDNGGVHINSGVGNKLCYLLTDGDTFNGQTITGMGISMVADLFYEAQTNLLTSGSDYADLHNSLTQAAINLGWNVADRNNLENACLATELSFSPPPSPDDNDECVNAICVEDNVPVNGTTIGATGTDITSCASGDAVDVWYSYTPSVSGSVMVSLCGSDYDTTLAIFDGCGGTELACNDDSCGLQSEIILSMTAGNTYLIRVSGYGGQTGTFVLNVTGGQGTCGSPPPSPSVIFSEDFENGLGGFIIDNAFGNGNGLWHLSTACNATLTGHTPVTALFYGLDDSCTYNNNRLVNQGVVTSPSINLEAYATGPIELEVKYFLETEGLPASYDLASIEISENGGLFTAIAHNDSIAAPVTLTDPSGGWVEILVDLSVYAGSSVQLRFGFNTVDRAVNDLAGFYIDDVTIYGPDSGCTPFPANPEPADGEINVPTDSLLQWDNLEAPGDLLQSSTSPDPDLTVGSLTTTFAGGNGQDGNMFDLTAKNAITITGWEGNINASGGPATIEVYYVTDHSSFVGKETNPALWTLLGSVTLATTNPRETPTFVEIGGLAIAASETIGIYWTTTSETNVSYTDGPLGVFENADLRFEDRGTGNAYPFGTVFSPRVWNGTIHYEIGGYDTTYDVYFDTDNPPATLIHSGLTDPSCEPIPYPLDDGTTYYWQVVAHNPGGCQADGRVWSFTTAGGGGCSPPGNPEPANGEADVATDLLLQWGVSEYSGFKFQNGGFLSKDQSSLDWKAKPPISEPEKALNANAPANASQDMLLFHQTPHAVSYVAIFQEEDPWGYAINQQVLTQNGIAYVIYDAASMGLVDLSAYDKVIISSVQDPGFYLSLEANKLWFENYVEAGGLLDIHIATYGEQPVLPGGFEITVLPAEDISIVDTDHPIVTLPNAITEAELNGWNYSVHGYISTVPAGAQEILEITSTGLPCAMELNVGLGSIFVTTQTVEWDGASYNYLENTVLYGADWAEETSVLVYDDYQPNGGFAQEALSNLGIGFVSVGGDQSAFDAQMDVGGWDLVIYDMAGVDINQSSRDRIKSYIESGGRVLMFWWDMDSDASLAASFEAAVVTDIYSPLPVYGPAPLHSIWTTPNIVNLPLDDTRDLMSDDGDILQPIDGGVILGSFTSAGGTSNNEAMVLGNSGRTILHGFSPDEVGYLDGDGSGKIDRVELYENEISFLLGSVPVGTTYDVYFDTIDPPLTLIHSGLTNTSCEPVPYPLALGTTYYWQVVAHNPGGCQAAGPVWSFRTSDSDCVLNCDLDHNEAVDLMDCSLLASQWLAFNCGTPDFCEGADFNHDGGVDFLDFMELANEWLFTCQTGTQNILLIEDQGGFGTAADVLIADGHNVIVLNDEYAAAYSHLLDTTFLNGFDLVVYGERGDGVGAVLPQAVADSLEAYIQGGGNLLVTGYDTLGSPTDAVLANLVRAVNPGDQVSSSAAWEVTGIDIPILNGPFGDFRNQSFSHLGYDDDYLIPDTSRGAVVLANTPGYSARVIFTDIPSPGGSVGYWNGGSGGTGNAQTDFSSGGIPQAIFQNWAATIGFGFNAPALLKNNWADIQKPVLSFDDLKRIAEKQK